ncbi:hypothetical protein SASPL_102198 [Salvia splendens]|uniref:DUF668 domain-containing protein n=1 Tax=Salvia splendens TaxID=180675 RepID=A0A8X8YW94_SALSN|nr:hypothetical protein SASPL_102198 [Salvia splendens]
MEKLASSPHLISLDERDDLYDMLPSPIRRRLTASWIRYENCVVQLKTDEYGQLPRSRSSYILTSRSDHDVQPAGTLRTAAIHRVRRQRLRELRPLDLGLPYGMCDPELPSSKESRPGHHSNGVVMPLLRGSTPQDPNQVKLEYLWTALDKLESRMEANDRRLERLRPLARQPSGWDSLVHCAVRRYSAYDQPRRSTYWDRPLYGQPPYIDMDPSYAPPRHSWLLSGAVGIRHIGPTTSNWCSRGGCSRTCQDRDVRGESGRMTYLSHHISE